jgi:pyrroline-5-carboxylate reductase
MYMKKIAIIGGGNLGVAIAEGLLTNGYYEPKMLTVTRRNPQFLQNLADKGVNITADNAIAVQNSDVIILAIKPFQVKDVLAEIAPHLQNNQLLVSVVTGVYIDDMLEVTGKQLPVFRAMPNTAIAIRESMTCISYKHASADQIKFIVNIFEQLGKAVIIDEKLMDAATVLGACGTAYAMRYIRANIQGGIEIGFDAATASLIAAQTVKRCGRVVIAKRIASRTGN